MKVDSVVGDLTDLFLYDVLLHACEWGVQRLYRCFLFAFLCCVDEFTGLPILLGYARGRRIEGSSVFGELLWCTGVLEKLLQIVGLIGQSCELAPVTASLSLVGHQGYRTMASFDFTGCEARWPLADQVT